MYSIAAISTLLIIASSAFKGLAAGVHNCPNVTSQAGGPPISIKPTLISPNAVKGFQIALFLETLEYAFFFSGLDNITQWGTEAYSNDTTGIVRKIVAQEEVHIATLVGLLQEYNETIPEPCNYSFPVNTISEFIDTADLITSIGIGAIVGLTEDLAVTDPLLLSSISSILAVESRHDAFFRHLQGLVPNPTPFDTGISAIWAYNVALSFIVPGSCPFEIPLPILSSLTVSNSYPNSTGSTSSRRFSWDPIQTGFVDEAGKELFIGWVNQLNPPIYTPLNITAHGEGTAEVPPGMNGAVYAAVTAQLPGTTNDLALATLAGPVVMRFS